MIGIEEIKKEEMIEIEDTIEIEVDGMTKKEIGEMIEIEEMILVTEIKEKADIVEMTGEEESGEVETIPGEEDMMTVIMILVPNQ